LPLFFNIEAIEEAVKTSVSLHFLTLQNHR